MSSALKFTYRFRGLPSRSRNAVRGVGSGTRDGGELQPVNVRASIRRCYVLKYHVVSNFIKKLGKSVYTHARLLRDDILGSRHISLMAKIKARTESAVEHNEIMMTHHVCLDTWRRQDGWG